MSWKDPRRGKFQVWKKKFWFFCPIFLPEIKRSNPQHRIFHEFGKYEYHFWRQRDSSKRYFLLIWSRSLSLFNCIFTKIFSWKVFYPLKSFLPPSSSTTSPYYSFTTHLSKRRILPDIGWLRSTKSFFLQLRG